MFDLTGKTALVTGSSQGIGLETAKVLRDAGATVFVHGRDMDKLKNAAKYVGTDKIVCADLCDENAAEKLFLKTSGVDILVLNASLQIKKPWDAFNEEDFDSQVTCNLKCTYFIIKKYIGYMKENKWGRIVTLGSVNQYNNHPELLVYGVTKAAQYKMVQNIAPYIAPFGITINNVAPGAIDTPRNSQVLSDMAFKEKVEASIPAGFIGSPVDIGGAILLLCSNEGRYITGSEIIIDGGMHL